jgi:site-specific recombinase XerD
MNQMRKAVEDYVELRRALGFKLTEAARGLRDFVSFLEERAADHITIPLALEWARQNLTARPAHWSRRLSWVRGLAHYCSAADSRTQVPPRDLLPHRACRARPYLYTGEEIQQLLTQAMGLDGLRGWTFHCLLGLLCVTGTRVTEALNLRSEDVDLLTGLLTIRSGKFGKLRLVPIHASTQKVLQDYVQRRDYAVKTRPVYFFVSQRGNRLSEGAVRYTFRILCQRIGLRSPAASRGPRLHDFRHRLAVQTLVRWYRSGHDVERRLPALSTYLGHVHIGSTYWYLSACPELMGLAVKRLQQRWEGLS